MKRLRLFSTLFLILLIHPYVYSQRNPLPDQLKEVSAVAPWKDSLLWMNDSGNDFSIYVTTKKGILQHTASFPEQEQVDIEDMTWDPKGNIYIGDIGNNSNKRKRLSIYKLNSNLEHIGEISFSYPDQKEYPPPPYARKYDAEAIVYMDGKIHLFTKSQWQSASYQCNHYILPSMPGQFTARLVESTVFPERVITSAALSPDGKILALLGYTYKKKWGLFGRSRTSIFLFEVKGLHFFMQPYREIEVPSRGATQYEAIEWIDSKQLLIASEKTTKEQHFLLLSATD